MFYCILSSLLDILGNCYQSMPKQIICQGAKLKPLLKVLKNLLEPDPDVLSDLGVIVAAVYERGGYDARIDYRTPVPPPALAEQDAAWVARLLTR